MTIKKIICNILKGEINDQTINRFVRHCQIMAKSYLLTKVSHKDNLLLNQFESIDDLAWDCIADVCRRDNSGCLCKVKAYFESQQIRSTAKESTLQIHLRRLIFSEVQKAIFRIYTESDPSLAKIIRNIKIHASEHGEYRVISDPGNEKIIVFSRKELAALPNIPAEFLEIRLAHHIGEKYFINEILELVSNIFAQQEHYRRAYPVTQLALSIRNVYAQFYEYNRTKWARMSGLFLNGELETMINNAVEEIKSDLYKTYVETNKLHVEVFETYLSIVTDILLNTYHSEYRDGLSNFEHFQQHIPDVEKSDYRSHHRKYIEYFVKRSRERLIKQIRRDFLQNRASARISNKNS